MAEHLLQIFVIEKMENQRKSQEECIKKFIKKRTLGRNKTINKGQEGMKEMGKR